MSKKVRYIKSNQFIDIIFGLILIGFMILFFILLGINANLWMVPDSLLK